MPVMFCFDTIIFRAIAASVMGMSDSASIDRMDHCCGVTFARSKIGPNRRFSRFAS